MNFHSLYLGEVLTTILCTGKIADCSDQKDEQPLSRQEITRQPTATSDLGQVLPGMLDRGQTLERDCAVGVEALVRTPPPGLQLFQFTLSGTQSPLHVPPFAQR